MVQEREFCRYTVFQEMDTEDRNYWFDFKQRKFLHNIDTFYYSVKFVEDFTADSTDSQVLQFREFFKRKYALLDANLQVDFIQIDIGGTPLNLCKCSFAYMYTICLDYPDWFTIFIAPSVPRGSDGGPSMTCEVVVQIRSYMLWMYGVHESFERSYRFVQMLADQFHLHIGYCQENRIDYCWHSNYLTNPERFFALDNFYKMRVDRFDSALTRSQKVGSDGYEIDYVAMGKRSDKVFIRIYLKSKEVVEQGYKGWFLYIWLFNGLINRYDLFVYEECYKRKSWKYLNMARAAFYLEYGQDVVIKDTCRKLLDGSVTMEEDTLQRFVDSITPKVHLVINVEYQTMRRHSKTYKLIPFRDNSSKLTSKRIYDYLDWHKPIMDYLTFYVFRLVEPTGDTNKSRRELCGFWKALRSCKLVDVHMSKRNIKLTRDYSRVLNAELVKTRAINSAVNYGLYMKGINDDCIMKDVMDALLRMNDNDMEKALRYKEKRTRQLNEDELPGSLESPAMHDFGLVDNVTGEIYDYNSINHVFGQGGVSYE